MIELRDYWMQRDKDYSKSLTVEIEHEAERTVSLANKLLETATLCGVTLPTHPVNGTHVSSGWRPPLINAATPNAAPNSKHMTGQAIDIYDPDGDLDDWLMSEKGQATLDSIGLWMEHPSATKSWSHLQSIPPNSGRRCFYP
jgi:hypothetical protein